MSVFISGATGFIAQHIVKQLTEKGYKVVGSVRSTEKGDRLKANVGENFQYEIVKDIGAEDAFDEALKKHPEVTVFLHTASPFHFKATDIEKELLIPAIKGTENALTSIKKYGPQIKKVVVTSSFAAVVPPVQDPTEVLREDSWNPITYEEALQDAGAGYRGSKKLAEKAAWEFVKTENPGFTLNTVNPGFVFGPQAFDSEVGGVLNTSSEYINEFLQLKPDDALPQYSGGFADVRDVAKAHLDAFESDTTNFRYLLITSLMTSQHIADIANKNFPQLKGKVPVGTPGSEKAIIAKKSRVDSSKTQAKIGKGIDLETSIVDSIRQILSSK